MVFFKKILWKAVTTLFFALMEIELLFFEDLNTLPRHGFNGSTYDFIIGKLSNVIFFKYKRCQTLVYESSVSELSFYAIIRFFTYL